MTDASGNAAPKRRWPRWARRGVMEGISVGLIVLGVAMLVQPFSLAIYGWSFTVAGTQIQTGTNGTAYLLTGSAADAEDAAQAAFVKAWSALPRFRRGAEFRPWLLRIVANEAHNSRRSANRRESLRVRVAAAEASGGAVPSPEAAALEEDMRRELLAAVNRLEERDRDVLTCRYFLELSEEETATVLHVRRGTVKSRLARGLERLRAELGEEDE